ncbi:GspMb/PilO family protein [Bacillus xiapuensis]|uniref:GspMb/PilO family protein n=1 Tax=Bacillus xiapuensis TaxID=2014075 RepID=UPI000C23CD55|nr:GspMb/PilO family protein [Bacillus xiapuensis]
MSLFQSRKIILILVSSLFLLGASVYFYYAVYKPLVLDIRVKQQEFKAEEKRIEALEGQADDSPANRGIVTAGLQFQVPVKPMTEKMLLDFEKAELSSNSLILEYKFTEGDAQTVAEENEGKPESLPAGIKKISAQLTVESPSYFELEAFLKKLEQQTRILQVEQMKFTAPTEKEELTGEAEALTCELTVAAYYMPELAELLEDQPKLDSPAPAKKLDPFVRLDK